MTSAVRAPTVGVFLLVLLQSQSALAATQGPVALVYEVSGEARKSAAGQNAEPVHLLDWLPAGTILETARGSRLALAFANGLRFELGEFSRVRVGKKGLLAKKGKVHALRAVPPFPNLSPIAAEDHPGPRAAALQIRGERMTGLYPRQGATALANETVLHFHAVAGTRTYRVEVSDGRGSTVFRAETVLPEVRVPEGVVRAGFAYRWTVRTLDRPISVASGEAELVILGDDSALARGQAHKILEAEGATALPLLAEIDRALGLLLESQRDLHLALDRSAGDTALLGALAELEAQLEEADEGHRRDPGRL